MKVTFSNAKTFFYRIGNTEIYTKEGTIANGQKYLNWTRELSGVKEKETIGVLERVPNKDYFSDLYSSIIRRTTCLLKDGQKTTKVEKLTNGKGSTLTVLENGIRSFKFVYDSDGNQVKTVFYDVKGLPIKKIEV